MAGVVVEFTGDEAKLWKSIQTLIQGADKMGASFDQASKKAKQADEAAVNAKKELAKELREEQNLVRQGVALTNSLLTPQERYNQKIREAGQLKSKGAITTETYNRQVSKLTDELAQATGVTDDLRKKEAELEAQTKKLAKAQEEAFDRELAAAAKRYTDEVSKGEAVTKRNVTAHEKLEQELREVTQLYKKGHVSAETYRREMERISAENEKLGESSSVFDSMTAKLGGMAAGYFSIETAIQTVIGSIQDFIDYQDRSLQLAKELAKSQQEAAKSFVGTSTPQMQKLFTDEAQSIAKETGYSNLPNIIDALGAANQTDDSSLDKVIQATRVAAKATTLTPEQTVPLTTGLMSISRETGEDDIEKNLGYLLSVGKLAKVTKPEKVAEIINQPLATAASLMPEQNKQETARTTGALFSYLTKVDPKGESSVTAAVTFEQKLDELFDGIASPEDNKKELDSLKKNKKDTRKWSKSKKSWDDSLTTKETKRMTELEDLVANPMQQASTTEERIVAVQNDKRLYDQLFDKQWGEAKYKQLFKNIVTKDSADYKEYQGYRNEIQFDEKVAQENIEQANSATPQLQIASSQERANAAIEVSKAGDIESQVRASIREMTSNALANTNNGFFTSMRTRAMKALDGAKAALGEIGSAKGVLESRKEDLEKPYLGFGKPSESDKEKISIIDATLNAIKEQEKLLIEKMEEQNRLVKEQNELIKNQQNQTALAPPPNAQRSNTINGASK